MLTIGTFEAAAQGDRDAVDAILSHYAPEIDALCTKQTRKRNGEPDFHIDEDMRHEIVRRLLADLPDLAARLRAKACADASVQTTVAAAVKSPPEREP